MFAVPGSPSPLHTSGSSSWSLFTAVSVAADTFFFRNRNWFNLMPALTAIVNVRGTISTNRGPV